MSNFSGNTSSIAAISVRKMTASGSILSTDDVITVNGGLTASLPNPTTTIVGKIIYVGRHVGTGGVVTINVTGGSLLENTTNTFAVSITTTTSKYAWVNNGTNWLMIVRT